MGLKDFRIVFDNQWSTYYSGQTVTGNIIVVLDSTKKIRGKDLLRIIDHIGRNSIRIENGVLLRKQCI